MLFAVAAIAAIAPVGMSAAPASANESITYIGADGKPKTITDYTLVGNYNGADRQNWSGGNYVVKDEVTISVADNDAIRITGNANLILCNGAKLNVTSTGSDNKAIDFRGDEFFNIFAQSGGTGQLTATGDIGIRSAFLSVYGGKVTLNGSSYGLYLADWGGSQNLTVNGGEVNITSTGRQSAIRTDTVAGYLTVNGGTLTVSNSDTGPAIDQISSLAFNGGTAKITGSEIISFSTIEMNCGNVTINGGLAPYVKDDIITLSYKSSTDTYKFSNLSKIYEWGDFIVKVADNKAVKVNGTSYTGELTDEQRANISNQEITPFSGAVSVASGITNGTVAADKTSNVLAGETVTLTVSPSAGYELSSLTVTKAGGGEVKTTKGSDGKYTFTMPAEDVTVSAVFSKIPATDPTITAQPSDLNLTIGAATDNTLTVAATAATEHTLSYQWYSNTTASNKDGTIITGETEASYAVPTTATGTTYYYCIVTATRADNGETATTTSSVATVTVNKGTDNGNGNSENNNNNEKNKNENENNNNNSNNSGDSNSETDKPSDNNSDNSESGSGGNSGKTDPVTPDNGKTDDNGSNSGGNDGGDDNGNGNDNGDTPDDKPDTEPEKTEEQKATEKQAKELVSNMDKTVANSEAGAEMKKVLQDTTDTNKQAAAVDVVNTLNDSLSSEEIAGLSKKDIESAVTNKQKEKAAAEKETTQNGGKVDDTKTPAGTDLFDNSDTVSPAVKKANGELSVKPKFAAPAPLSESDIKEIKEKLANRIGTKQIMSGGIHVNTTEEDKDLDKQATKLEDLIKLIVDTLAKITNTAIGKGAAVTVAGANERGLVLATLLPEITVDADGYYPMGVNLRNVTPGRVLSFWPSADYIDRYAAGEVGEYDAYFLDENDNVVTKVTGDASKMKVVPYLEKGKTYDTAFIAVNATENDLKALETLATELNSGSNDSPTSDKGSGGCDAGLGLAGLSAVIPLFRKKRS